jgi:hypothetical protein
MRKESTTRHTKQAINTRGVTDEAPNSYKVEGERERAEEEPEENKPESQALRMEV